MPKGANLEKRPEGDDEVVLGIDDAGGYFLNGVPIPAGRWRTSCASSSRRGPEDKILYFRADKELQYGKIQEAVETARRSGVRVMAAITELKRRQGPVRTPRTKKRSVTMAGGGGGAPRATQRRAQRHSDDRHHAGAADHLHDHAAADADGDRRAGAAAGAHDHARRRPPPRSCWRSRRTAATTSTGSRFPRTSWTPRSTPSIDQRPAKLLFMKPAPNGSIRK